VPVPILEKNEISFPDLGISIGMLKAVFSGRKRRICTIRKMIQISGERLLYLLQFMLAMPLSVNTC